MTISPDTLRRRLLANKQTIKAVLGDGQGNVLAQGRTGEVWVRVESGVDDAGNTTYSPPFAVRHNPGATYQTRSGFPVRLGLDYDNELAVLNADFAGAVGLGVDMAAYNPGNQYANQVTNLNNVSYLRSYAPATSTTPTTEVAVQQFNYQASDGTYTTFRPAPADRIDLATYAPGTAGQKRLVCIYLDTVNNALGVTQGTAKVASVAFNHSTDVAEVIDACPVSAIPVAVWSIENGQTTVTGDNLYYDARQWISTPDRVVISTSDPTVNDDVDSGYARWQRWVNTTDDALFICADNTSGAAVWTEVGSGGGGLSSFDITDGTTTDTVDGTDDTITFASSSTVEATVSATNTVVHEVPDGSLSAAKLSFTPLQSFDVTNGTTTDTVDDTDNTLTFVPTFTVDVTITPTNLIEFDVKDNAIGTTQLSWGAVTNPKMANDAVEERNILDDAVSLAKIESVPANAGYFIGYDASGDPAALAGTFHIETITIGSTVASISQSVNTGLYLEADDLIIVFNRFVQTAGTSNPLIILNGNSTSGGYSRCIYDTGSVVSFTSSVSAFNAFIVQNQELSGYAVIHDFRNASVESLTSGVCTGRSSASVVFAQIIAGAMGFTGAVTSLQFSWSNGNISSASDSIEIYGRKHG